MDEINYSALSTVSRGREVYRGVYGEWEVEESDVKEVLGYRAGISVAAAALLLDSAIALGAVDGTALQFLREWQDALCLVGAGGLGVSLVLIHIYVAPLKRFLQLLWAAGVMGGISIMATQSQPLTEYVASHPGAVWFVGPFFAAVTGVAFKEGVCYGKPECAVLFFITPALLLGHLSGMLPQSAERTLLLAFLVTSLIFAGRKYTQPIKDDIGDKSVFQFLAMSEEQQQELLLQREQEKLEEQ
ncbi:g8229 [Coccomyxa elongata]